MADGIRWWRNRERGTTDSALRAINDDLDRHDWELDKVRIAVEDINKKQDEALARINYLLVAVVMLLLGAIANIIVIVSLAST